MKLPYKLALIGLAAATAACADPITSAVADASARFAHESNNQSVLSGTQDGNAISGNAIINYVKGVEGWQSTVSLSGNLAPDTYTFYAVAPMGGALRTICSFTVTDQNGGRKGCSANTDVAGFATAQIQDSNGNIVASGTFERRGGNREK